MRHKFLVLALALCATAPAFAQNGVNFAWWNSRVADNLNLSVAQRQQIREIVRSYRGRLIDARSNVQKAEGDLQDVFNADHVDPKQAQPVIERVAQARAESVRVFTEMSINLRSVLTSDQWRELVTRWGSIKRGRKPSDTQVEP